MTFQSGILPGGNASLSEVSSRAGFPGLQRTLTRNLWGKAQTEGVTRSSEVGRDRLPITLDSCNTFQAKNMPTIILSWSVCLWWAQQALRFWRCQLRNSIYRLAHQQCPVPPRYLSSSCTLLLEGRDVLGFNCSLCGIIAFSGYMGSYVIESNHLIFQSQNWEWERGAYPELLS